VVPGLERGLPAAVPWGVVVLGAAAGLGSPALGGCKALYQPQLGSGSQAVGKAGGERSTLARQRGARPHRCCGGCRRWPPGPAVRRMLKLN